MDIYLTHALNVVVMTNGLKPMIILIQKTLYFPTLDFFRVCCCCKISCFTLFL